MYKTLLAQVFFHSIAKKKLYFFWLPRLFSLLLVPGFLFDIEILFLFHPIILLHASLGLSVIIEDYIHIETIKFQYLSLIKLLLVLLINLNILYLL
uniref:Succinate dehydrogenase membrane anchor subunit n=1 Tax=Porphyra purpurea TaxID=2787 RepID=DHSD_PORPU|nr:succinate:cytochrome c oxidoreductase subunit 4 [Porphyra purpurea]P80479.1 RecName: Full=Succinate dehydrogenase membrane anchor subunit; AltName: Full=Succinate dehydrogenase, subunit IV [Porphyra purpurea]AAD03108.1 succinate:cytochrome c oxidoreductase subunit 4 [Porphyra purpurea]